METSIAHVTCRGNARESIFQDDVDYATFVRMSAQVVVDRAWTCHAFCLMPNHYHLLLETPAGELGKGMHLLNGRYARRFNVRHGRVGHVFGSRYRATAVTRDAHLLDAARYVDLNPVRGGLCARAGDWPWSSYAGEHTWVDRLLVRALAGGEDGYRRFVADGVERLQSALKQTAVSGTR